MCKALLLDAGSTMIHEEGTPQECKKSLERLRRQRKEEEEEEEDGMLQGC